jgi:DNA replication initiation complex subunit (GINS family)
MNKKVSSQVCELLKRYRKVPTTACLTAAGGLTTRETWLYDRLIKIIEGAQQDLAQSIQELACAKELSTRTKLNSVIILTRSMKSVSSSG